MYVGKMNTCKALRNITEDSVVLLVIFIANQKFLPQPIKNYKITRHSLLIYAGFSK